MDELIQKKRQETAEETLAFITKYGHDTESSEKAPTSFNSPAHK
jgi:hypothetical protein